jgi:hypothetical protein
MWSQGLDAGARESEIARIYAGAADAGALLERYAVGFVLVGPHERRLAGFDPRALARFPLVASEGAYELRAVR